MKSRDRLTRKSYQATHQLNEKKHHNSSGLQRDTFKNCASTKIDIDQYLDFLSKTESIGRVLKGIQLDNNTGDIFIIRTKNAN